MMDDDCDIEGFSTLEENIANGSQRIFVTKPTGNIDKMTLYQDFDLFWNEKSQYTSQRYITPDTRGIIIDYLEKSIPRFAQEEIKTILLAYQMSLEAGNVTDVLIDIKNRIQAIEYSQLSDEVMDYMRNNAK